MSAENAKMLLDKVSHNDDIKAQLKVAGNSGFHSFAISQGLDCTLEEFTDAAKMEATHQLNQKLSDITPGTKIGCGTINVI